ncbi:MAG TPA: anti-sigma factor [Mycobacteriales bacterium]|nr:anti-sigma factor [Mycobacteriales bacterium]
MSAEHDKWEALAVGHVLAALEPEDEGLFAGHLKSCSLCERTIAEMTSVASHLAYAAEPADPPPALKASILDAVSRSGRPAALPAMPRDGAGRVVALRTSRPDVSTWARVLSMAAGLALVVGLGVWNVNLRQNAELADQAIARMSRVERLAADPSTVRVAMTSGIGAKGTALVRGKEVAVLLDGLPRNDATSIYVLWYQDDRDVFHAFETFDVREADHVNVVESSLALPIAEIRAIAISREPGRVAPRNPSSPLMHGKTGEATA